MQTDLELSERLTAGRLFWTTHDGGNLAAKTKQNPDMKTKEKIP